MALLIPMISPSELRRGPPEFPGLMAASVWMMSSIKVPVSERIVRPRELMIPVVSVLCRPKGFPMARTF